MVSLPALEEPLALRYPPTEDGPQVAVDAPTLESILRSLVENALQHGARSVAVEAKVEDAWVRIAVIDDGPGVSPENRSRVFDPFFTTARDAGGTGLGLAVVAALLSAHHGEIVLSDAAPGATFEIRVPLASPS